PEHPERWGLSLLTLQDTDSSFIEVLQPEKENDTAVADESTEMPADATEHRNDGALVDLRPVTNDQRRQARFDLERTSDVHVEAVGEITLSNRYDYGWIEDAESGRILWEMTYGNTTAAGGDSRNRRFDGVIKLPPGSYVAIYQSDFSHAYGDFRSQEEEPDDPRAWGMIIRQPDR
ncbi:MAG: hypothetical protein ACOCTG_01035, partial [Bacteroidota bacterium]